MTNKKNKYITLAVALFYLLLLIGWHCYDPTQGLTEAVPGADHRPEGNARRADEVVIGEYFMAEEKPEQVTPLSGEWPCFRGADRNNQITNQPLRKLIEDNYLEQWTIETGEGHAAPVISEGKVYLLDYNEKMNADELRCLELTTGKQLWRRWYRVPMKRNHGFSRTIPAISQDMIVTIGPEGHVMCCDKNDGSLHWTLDMKKRFGTEIPFWYTGQCPLIEDGNLILAPAGTDTLMVGIDLKSGEIAWSTENKIGLKMSHSSIMPMVLNGTRTYTYIGVGGVCGVSGEKESQGKLLWSTNRWQPSVVAPSPLQISNNQIFLVAGYGAGGALLQVDKGSNGWEAVIKDSYKANAGMSCEQQTPINYHGTLITILPKDGGGMRERLAMYTPDNLHAPIWTSAADERFGLGPYLIIDNLLFAFKEDGELYTYQVNPKSMTLLHKQRIMEEGIDAWGPLAYADGFLLLRDSKTVKCLKVFE